MRARGRDDLTCAKTVQPNFRVIFVCHSIVISVKTTRVSFTSKFGKHITLHKHIFYKTDIFLPKRISKIVSIFNWKKRLLFTVNLRRRTIRTIRRGSSTSVVSGCIFVPRANTAVWPCPAVIRKMARLTRKRPNGFLRIRFLSVTRTLRTRLLGDIQNATRGESVWQQLRPRSPVTYTMPGVVGKRWSETKV